ncbi:MAG: RDD family protein [Methylocystis sp.]
MSYGDGQGGVSPRPLEELAPPRIPRAALDGVRTRRVLAVCLDFVIVCTLSALIFTGLLFLSFGMTAILLPPIFPLVAFFYNGLTVSGWRMATPGMRFVDLEMRAMTGERVPFINAAVHAVLFYVTTLLPPLLLLSFVNGDKRCLHDILADVIVLRRSAPAA